eukprot:TRINITY_DN775_c0_g1_i1.p1 TRINITY_DN775_c0_g1~~TRINITY_DN775_c0_g1_i1.p1  ORF type:complete len:230 (+),score=39.68 TRINITY_DN775_c0_g1_i1:131-820(+)
MDQPKTVMVKTCQVGALATVPGHRFILSSHTSWPVFVKTLCEAYGLQSAQLCYIDDEGDLISLGSYDELREALRLARTSSAGHDSPVLFLHISLYPPFVPLPDKRNRCSESTQQQVSGRDAADGGEDQASTVAPLREFVIDWCRTTAEQVKQSSLATSLCTSSVNAQVAEQCALAKQTAELCQALSSQQADRDLHSCAEQQRVLQDLIAQTTRQAIEESCETRSLVMTM